MEEEERQYAHLPPLGRQVCGTGKDRAPASCAGDQAAAGGYATASSGRGVSVMASDG